MVVEEAEEFSGGGEEGDFGGFAGLAEALVEGGQRGVGTDDGEGGQVEGTTDSGATAADVAVAGARAAVVVVGSEAREGADLAAGGVAEFGKQSEQDGGGGGTDAVLALEGVVARRQGGVLGDGGGQEGLELVDLRGQAAELGLEAAAGLGQAPMLGALEQLGAQVNELVTHGAQLGELADARIHRRSGGRVHGTAEVGQDAGVEPIGLGQLALGPGEGPDLPRIKHGDGPPGALESVDQRPFVAAVPAGSAASRAWWP